MALATWDSTFEGIPAGTESAGLGDNRILDLKENISRREQVEHDFGDATITTGYGDTGRHIEGSARAFVETTAPVGLVAPDGTVNNPGSYAGGSVALDGGRLWADNTTATDPLLYVHDGSSWVQVVAQAPLVDSDTATSSTRTTGVDFNASAVDILSLSCDLDVPSTGSHYIHVVACMPWETSTTSLTQGLLMEEEAALGQNPVAFDSVRYSSGPNPHAFNFQWFNFAPTGGVAYHYTLAGEGTGASSSVTINPTTTDAWLLATTTTFIKGYVYEIRT